MSSESGSSKLIINPESSDLKKPSINAEELRMQGQMLRIKANLHLKNIQDIWVVSEEDLPDYFNNYEPMPYSNIHTQQLFELDRIKMIKTENKLYFGQIQNKKKHGKGIVLYRQGKLYEGDFVLNEKSGHGCEVYTNGNVYIGHFSQNKKHGKGSFFWYSLCESKEQKEIEQYHGEWWGGLPDGFGEHHKINGDLYVGKFKNGLKHGDGYEIYHNGDKYKGEFVNGFSEGYGDYQWADGSFYKGDFKQGSRNGYGIWKSKTELYKGHYMLDKKHGYGIYDWGNGYIYKGQWMEDLRHGQGTLLFNNQVQYDGYWENGEQVDEKPSVKPITNLKQSGIQNRSQSKDIKDDGFGNTSYSRGETAKTRKRNTSAERSRKGKEQFSVQFNKSRNRDHSQSHSRSKCGHRNCIPTQQFGKMPKPNWKP